MIKSLTCSLLLCLGLGLATPGFGAEEQKTFTAEEMKAYGIKDIKQLKEMMDLHGVNDVNQLREMLGPPPQTVETKPIDYFKYEIDPDKIEKMINDTCADLKEKFEGNKLMVTQIMACSANLNFWFNHPYLEVDTGISKKWYDKILLAIDNLIKLKRYLMAAQLKKDKAGIEQGAAGIQKVLKILSDTVKKPDKISDERMKELREWRQKNEEKRLKAEKLKKQKEKATKPAKKKKAEQTGEKE